MEVLIDRGREVSLSVSLRQYVNWLLRHAPPRPAAAVNEGAMSADHAIAAAAVVSAAASASVRARGSSEVVAAYILQCPRLAYIQVLLA